MIQVFFSTRNIKTQKIGTHMQAFPLKNRKRAKTVFLFSDRSSATLTKIRKLRFESSLHE